MTIKAILVLADGSIFEGVSVGVDGCAIGEVVFNTSMTGYQEILTDPSYTKQLVTLTYPHIGNTGTNNEDFEGVAVYAAGLIIRDLPFLHSSFRANDSLSDYLIRNNTVAIADIDTRRLTRLLRNKGAQAGCILTGSDATVEVAMSLAKSFGSMEGKDLASVVSCESIYDFNEGQWQLKQGFEVPKTQPYFVVTYDFGVKTNILRMLVSRGCRVTVVPAKTPAKEVLALNPDGVFLSNGPGDPKACEYAIDNIKALLLSGKPLFGICLGHQLLGLAKGGKTKKMAFGHHGANHPVKDLQTGKVHITSQNHGFELDANSLPDDIEITHTSLFDGTLQGIQFKDQPVFSFQGHPESSPGPHDVSYLFDRFINTMACSQGN